MGEIKTIEANSPAEMIRMAVAGNADLDKLRQLLDIQKDWEANEARKVFASAFAIAQKGMLSVTKKKYNQQTKSKYADLSDIIESSKTIYTKEGFSIIFYEGDTTLPEHMRIYADVLHSAGHKETYHYDIPLDGKGIQGNANMTKIHGKASSTAYGRRYLMCMIWNIPTQDNDGNVDQTKISEKQVSELLDILDNLPDAKVKKEKFLKYMEVAEVKSILAKDYEKGIKALQASKEKVK